jgi:hypothetical protein
MLIQYPSSIGVNKMFEIKERTNTEGLKFQPGDRVIYPEKVLNYVFSGKTKEAVQEIESKDKDAFKIKHGVISRIVEQTDPFFGIGNFDEFYEVLWDDGTKQTFTKDALKFEDETRNPPPEVCDGSCGEQECIDNAKKLEEESENEIKAEEKQDIPKLDK